MKYIIILFVFDTFIGNINKKVLIVGVFVKMYKRICLFVFVYCIVLIIVCKKIQYFFGLVLFYIIEKSYKMITNNEGYYIVINLKIKED